ncbi:MAG TPA: nucleotidyltransferase family protein [Bacteroidales bacterium]|nr:nucleotidyltransferase family protein [Bacteroidales bacterium]HOM41484.1 nucleotidyltransferase family protein [Bacteroidales bacterium]HPP92232.1 nucleotidyltransferase family protein [Bacteroidales bacterium]
MNKNEINNLLINYFRPYKPVKIGIFGSFARDEQTKDSDIDILIKFQNTISLLELARIKRELSQILGREIDIITENSLKNENLKKYIYKDLKIIFE